MAYEEWDAWMNLVSDTLVGMFGYIPHTQKHEDIATAALAKEGLYPPTTPCPYLRTTTSLAASR